MRYENREAHTLNLFSIRGEIEFSSLAIMNLGHIVRRYILLQSFGSSITNSMEMQCC